MFFVRDVFKKNPMFQNNLDHCDLARSQIFENLIRVHLECLGGGSGLKKMQTTFDCISGKITFLGVFLMTNKGNKGTNVDVFLIVVSQRKGKQIT